MIILLTVGVLLSIISLVSDDLDDVKLSLSSEPAQNDDLVLVVLVAPIARAAECRSPFPGSVAATRIWDLLIVDYWYHDIARHR